MHFHLCLDTTDSDKIVETVKLLEPTFGGVNLEDIAAPDVLKLKNACEKSVIFPFFMMINMVQRLSQRLGCSML